MSAEQLPAEDPITMRITIDAQNSVICRLHREKDAMQKRIDQLQDICKINAETILEMQRARA